MTFRSALIIILIFAAQSVIANDTYQFQPAVVELTGKLVDRVFFGPPGYGDDPRSDSKDNVAILRLFSPIKVVAEESDDFNETRDNVKKVQLFNKKDIDLTPYFNQKVTVSGKLSSSIGRYHHADVIIEFDTIRLLK